MLGISLHKMDAGLDTGPLLTQATCQAVDGESLEALEIRLAETGAGLFSAALGNMRIGLEFREQPGEGQSQQGWPQAEDFIIDCRRPARVVYNFLMAMRAAGKPCGLRRQNTVLNVRAVLGWQPRKVTIDGDAGILEIETGE
jgi:methionyl-tRNA formyltransferase